MAYAKVRTLIPLDNVPKILQIDPLHFNSIYTELRPIDNACDDIYTQHDWQFVGKVSRESIASALKQAEDLVIDYLGYYPVPHWVQEEEHELARPFKPELYYVYNMDVRGKRQTITTNYGYFIEGGRKSKSLIEAGSAVTYSDEDGDGFNETGTVTVATTVSEPSEISVYYPGYTGADIWEIRPTTVTIGAGIATITFKKYQVALEELLERLAEGPGDSYRAIDGDDDTNFIATVDVYHVYNDPSEQLSFVTENYCSSCSGTGCTACEGYEETGCMYARDKRNGIVAINRADWDEDEEKFVYATFDYCHLPDKVNIWYRSGKQNKDLDEPLIQMDPTWERMIVLYALTLIDTELCGCDNTKRIVSHWREDLSRPKTEGAFAISSANLSCPLGTSRAAIDLWKMITSPGHRLARSR